MIPINLQHKVRKRTRMNKDSIYFLLRNWSYRGQVRENNVYCLVLEDPTDNIDILCMDNTLILLLDATAYFIIEIFIALPAEGDFLHSSALLEWNRKLGKRSQDFWHSRVKPWSTYVIWFVLRAYRFIPKISLTPNCYFQSECWILVVAWDARQVSLVSLTHHWGRSHT